MSTPNAFPYPEVLDAFDALGSAIRGDWGTIDGRSVRDGIARVTAALRAGNRPTYEQMCELLDVCPTKRSWAEHCDEPAFFIDEEGTRWPDPGTWDCGHLCEVREQKRGRLPTGEATS